MKKISLVVVLLVLIITGCTKKYYYGSEGNDNPPYIVQGINDFSINEDSGPSVMGLSIMYQNSDQENVKVSLENVPAGLFTIIERPSGIPSFSSFIQFTDSSATPGTYTVNLVVTGAKSGKKSFPFTITVTTTPDCRDEIIGTYSTSSLCSAGPSNYSSDIEKDVVNKRIIIKNWENSGEQVFATTNCINGQLTIPSQTVNGVTYSGNGSFGQWSPTQMRVSISYTRTTSSGSSGCNVFMTN